MASKCRTKSVLDIWAVQKHKYNEQMTSRKGVYFAVEDTQLFDAPVSYYAAPQWKGNVNGHGGGYSMVPFLNVLIMQDNQQPSSTVTFPFSRSLEKLDCSYLGRILSFPNTYRKHNINGAFNRIREALIEMAPGVNNVARRYRQPYIKVDFRQVYYPEVL